MTTQNSSQNFKIFEGKKIFIMVGGFVALLVLILLLVFMGKNKNVICEENSIQECGIDNGQCQKGTQECIGDLWGLCEGAVSPTNEICDNLDNDCDNEIDEFLNCDEDGNKGSFIGENKSDHQYSNWFNAASLVLTKEDLESLTFVIEEVYEDSLPKIFGYGEISVGGSRFQIQGISDFEENPNVTGYGGPGSPTEWLGSETIAFDSASNALKYYRLRKSVENKNLPTGAIIETYDSPKIGDESHITKITYKSYKAIKNESGGPNIIEDFYIDSYSTMFVYENILVGISVIGKKDMDKEGIVDLAQIIIDKAKKT